MQLEEQKSYLVISNLTLYLGYLISYVFLLYFTFKLFRVDYFNPIVVNFVKIKINDKKNRNMLLIYINISLLNITGC